MYRPKSMVMTALPSHMTKTTSANNSSRCQHKIHSSGDNNKQRKLELLTLKGFDASVAGLSVCGHEARALQYEQASAQSQGVVNSRDMAQALDEWLEATATLANELHTSQQQQKLMAAALSDAARDKVDSRAQVQRLLSELDKQQLTMEDLSEKLQQNTEVQRRVLARMEAERDQNEQLYTDVVALFDEAFLVGGSLSNSLDESGRRGFYDSPVPDLSLPRHTRLM